MLKIKSSIFIIILIFFSGCNVLTPYDNEFTCKPTVIGKCSKSIKKTYKNTVKEIEKGN